MLKGKYKGYINIHVLIDFLMIKLDWIPSQTNLLGTNSYSVIHRAKHIDLNHR